MINLIVPRPGYPEFESNLHETIRASVKDHGKFSDDIESDAFLKRESTITIVEAYCHAYRNN